MDTRRHQTPPPVAARLLGWLLADQWDTRVGDYEEYFNELAAERGLSAARWWYRGQVLRLLPDRLYEKAFWSLVMLKSYVLLGFRSMQKHRVASAINVVGLSAAVACAVALFLVLRVINTNDTFHEHADRLFLVGHVTTQDDATTRWGTAPLPLAPALAADFPQVERAVRVAEQPALVRPGQYAFHETLSFADPGFFEVLTFPLSHGRAALDDPQAVVLSAETAARYFGDQDAVGRTLEVTFETGVSRTLTVSGVAAPFSAGASLRFDLLAAFALQPSADLDDPADWAAHAQATIVQLRRADDAPSLAAGLGRYLPVQQAADPDRPAQAFFLDSVADPDWRTAWNIEDRAMLAPLLWESLLFGLIAVLMLLVACFNYVTISLGAAAQRLKEIGIRKTVGAERRQLVTQFLVENLVLCLLALGAGLVLAWTVVVPFLNARLFRPIPLDFLVHAEFWVFLVGLLAFVGLASGAYPAFYVSSFRPTAILRDTLRIGEKRLLTRVLTTTQFVLAFVTVCLTLFTASLDDALLGGDWGYAPDDLLVVPVGSPEQSAHLRQEAMQLPQVQRVGGALHHVGTTRQRTTVQVGAAEQQAYHFAVGPDYLEALGLEATAGRAFGTAFAADSAQAVVVNQTFAAQQAWTDPVGEPLQLDARTYTVVGVVEDFLLAPFVGKAVPVVLRPADAAQHRFVVLAVAPGTADAVQAALAARWTKTFPDRPFEPFTQADVFAADSLDGLSKLIAYLAVFALLVSCMGLFGIASQRAARRVKEIGVRKAMGATAWHVVLLVNRGFLGMLALASLIATPLCYLALRTAVHLAPVPLSLELTPFVGANAVMLGVAALTLSLQTRRLARVQPAEVLRRQ